MGYTISQASDKSGISIHTLRFYDREGLMPYVDRNESGIRVFKDSDLEWLNTISCLKRTGMPLKKIRDFINLCMQGDETLEARLQIIKEHQAACEERIRAMEQYMVTIKNKRQHYERAVSRKNSAGSNE